jgi:group I intron endonuclease
MPVNYQLAKIYTIVNDLNDTVYVGSTAQKLLSSRMSCHRRLSTQDDRTSDLYNAMKTLGVDHFRIVLLRAFPCNSKDELEAEEYKVLKTYTDAGKHVYNMRTADGIKVREETKAKIRTYMLTHGKKGELAPTFKYGSVRYSPKIKQWRIEWYETQKKKTKSFSENIWGVRGAKTMAFEFRQNLYPKYVMPAEEAVIHELLAIEMD